MFKPKAFWYEIDLTCLSDFEYVAYHICELDTGFGKWQVVVIIPVRVFQHHLHKQNNALNRHTIQYN